MRKQIRVRHLLMIPQLLSLLSLGLGVSIARAQDEADTKRERRLHEVYKKFNVNPTPQQAWDEAIASQPEQTYLIQKGDTLWDVSDTFFGDNEFWPKLWSVNKGEIFNPHEINPGDRIAFTPGSLAEPPVFDVTDEEEEAPEEIKRIEPKEKGEAKKEVAPVTQKHEFVDIDLADLDIPPGHYKKGATIPPVSLPHWVMRKDPDRTFVTELKQITRSTPAPQVDVFNYIQDTPISPTGEIIEAEAGMMAAHENQYVVVKAEGAAPGQKYLVVRELGNLQAFAQNQAGTIVQVDGEVIVREVVNSDEHLYRAFVTKAHSVVDVGSKLVSGELQKVTILGGGATVEAHARVVGGSFSKERSLFGPGEVVFLDTGASPGLAPGAILNIYRVEKLRSEETLQHENPRLIGSVQVVRGGQNFATAIVVTAIEEIEVGDSTSRQNLSK